MKPGISKEANSERLLGLLLPYIRQLLQDAPDFGEISISASLHEGDIGRIRLGAEVSRCVAPRTDRGGTR